MKYIPLGTVCSISIGRTPPRGEPKYWGKGHKWVSISDMKEKVIISTKEEITETALDAIRCKKIPKGTLLLSFKLSIGKRAFAGDDLFTNEAIAALIINDSKILDNNYLYFALGSIKLIGGNNAAMGTTLNSKSLAALKIPLPQLIDQKRITSILTLVENLIAQRKESIHLLDELLKSTFLEMFGDPVRNEKGWDVHRCSDVVFKITSGKSYSGEEKGFLSDDELGVLKISAVTNGFLKAGEFKAVKKTKINVAPKLLSKGDFLISRANTYELVAACCIVDKDYINLFIPDKLWRLSFSESINPQYFNYLMKNENYRNIIRRKASGGHKSMLNISMKKFYSLSVPVPPIDFQNQFASIVEKVESMKSRYQQSLNELENLYGSLSKKAFKGELDLSRVPLEYVENTESELVSV